MQLSVIIVNFNTFNLTVDCIHSIEATTQGVKYEVIVVDNAPKVDYRPELLNLFPDIKYVLSKENPLARFPCHFDADHGANNDGPKAYKRFITARNCGGA